MTKQRQPKIDATWMDIKARLKAMDRAGLVGLIADLYAANPKNRSFLHARFSVGANPLAIYKKRIEQALYPKTAPDPHQSSHPDIHVAQAKKAISEYQKAIGFPLEVLELRIYFCEVAMNFALRHSYDDSRFYEAIWVQLTMAARAVIDIDEKGRERFITRLGRVCNKAAKLGYEWDDPLSKQKMR